MNTVKTTSVTTQKIPAILQFALGALLMLACTYIRIPLPFSPVPLTLQTLAALYLGLYLGKNRGAIAALTGLVIHPLLLAGPTGGYIIGFAVMAYLMGTFCHNQSRSTLYICAVATIVSLIQLAMGTAWLAIFTGTSNALIAGFIPFLAPAMLKVAIVSSFRPGANS